jgi:hypothetical protein
MKTLGNILFQAILLCAVLSANAQITPQQANAAMARGINIGNTLESETEGSWGNGPLQEYYFDDYKTAGFTSIRIPIRWDKHTANTSPYKVDDAWMKRVEQVVDWGLARGLYITINSHHDDWIKTGYANKIMRDRFDSIWSQIAVRFQHKSDKLLFEMINEPHELTVPNINEINLRVLSIIRKTNPTRIVIYSGTEFSSLDKMIEAAIPNDPNLIAYYHSYDPWSFAGQGISTWGSASDRETLRSAFAKAAQWSTSHNIPVTINEFGAQKLCEYNSRMYHYASYTEYALQYGVSFNAWDDGGDFQIYLRSNRKWNDIKDIVAYTSDSSTTQLKVQQVVDQLKLSWVMRSSSIDSIKIERKIENGTFQTIATIPGDSTSYFDNTTLLNKYYYYRVVAKYANGAAIPSYPIRSFRVLSQRSPYGGIPIAIPGVIQAENFDIGGEMFTYHDSDLVNTQGKYRTDVGVDIQSRDDGFQISNIATGEWLEYTVNIAEAGEYVIDTWTASLNGGGKFSFTIGTVSTSIMTAPKTSSTKTLAKTTTTKTLKAGEQIIRLKLIALPAFYVDRIEIYKKSNSANNLKIGLNYLVSSSTPGFVTVEMKNEEPSEISIYNSAGRREFKGSLNHGINEIRMTAPGIFLYRIEAKSGNRLTGKIGVK